MIARDVLDTKNEYAVLSIYNGLINRLLATLLEHPRPVRAHTALREVLRISSGVRNVACWATFKRARVIMLKRQLPSALQLGIAAAGITGLTLLPGSGV